MIIRYLDPWGLFRTDVFLCGRGVSFRMMSVKFFADASGLHVSRLVEFGGCFEFVLSDWYA